MYALYGANNIHRILNFRGLIAYMVGDVTRGAGHQFFTEREKSPFYGFRDPEGSPRNQTHTCTIKCLLLIILTGRKGRSEWMVGYMTTHC